MKKLMKQFRDVVLIGPQVFDDKLTSKVTKLSLAIIFSYLVCWTPYWVIRTATVLLPKGADVWTVLNLLLKICLIFAFSLPAINPLLYVFCGEKFKFCLEKIFTQCNKKTQENKDNVIIYRIL
ncbi:somatostatin receptor type 2-like protein [Leptotrombidium deliense]|uniref:Somatostatin receptor type 2-like protein n=1 Tax=Leptotrombidium deliense TaxID=299467 RepID=A0A443S722_9ACAR|nr:somatostatin receptor type 2-like protein [Leptotrombidium deliense]